jgi:hypothetical protein
MSNCHNFKNPEYNRLMLQLSHERNENNAGYIRLTDGGIWGFLGVAVIELFKDQNFPFTNVLIFLMLVTFSMYIWRLKVKTYQKSIIEGYRRMAECEENLAVPFPSCISQNFVSVLNLKSEFKPKGYRELCNLLTPEKYYNPQHKQMNYLAFIWGSVGLLLLSSLIFIGFYENYSFIIVLVAVLAFIGWLFKWQKIIFNLDIS